MIRYIDKYVLLLMLSFCTSCGQNQAKGKKIIINSKTKGVITPYGPKWITRNIIKDRNGNIWVAAFDGIFRYDGKSFINITSKVSSARFFSVLEDRKGNFWFGSIGSGVYYYDGKSIQNFTTKDGLSNNDVNSVIEDKTGKFWFATRGDTFVYDGKTFAVFTHDGKPFTNVRSMIEDKKGNIWLGGADGLWRYDGSTFTNFTQKFVGHIIEDKKGNIWTSSESANSPPWVSSETGNIQAWALSRYDGKSLSDKKPMVTEITNKGMIFGILEAFDGSIWFGTFDGVHRYDGKTITDFKDKQVQK